MARRHPIAVAIKQHADGGWVGEFSAIVALGGVAGELSVAGRPRP
jgi:hypothetical protein